MKSIVADKLEVINEMNLRFKGWINEDLSSIKFCRNDKMVFLELNFTSSPDAHWITIMDFISGDELSRSLFFPDIDFVDNAFIFINLDQNQLLNSVEGLFTKEAEQIIESSVNRPSYKSE